MLLCRSGHARLDASGLVTFLALFRLSTLHVQLRVVSAFPFRLDLSVRRMILCSLARCTMKFFKPMKGDAKACQQHLPSQAKTLVK